MTVEEEEIVEKKVVVEKNKKKKNVLVGIRLDQHDRLLVNWTLSKVAEPDDNVIALHVCRDFASEKSLLLDDYLEVYKGLCHAKQVDLIGKVSCGTSVKRILVKEAKLCEAMIVVVGISSRNALSGWISVANYCSKKLPHTTTVLAVHDGKVIFQRGFTNKLPGLKGDWARSLNPIQPQSPTGNQSCFVVSEVPELENSQTKLVDDMEDRSKDDGGETKHKYFDAYEFMDETSSSSISAGDTQLESCNSVDDDREEISSNSIDELVKETIEMTPGWPLLKKASSASHGSVKESAERRMSVVQWAMSLPRRNYSSSSQTESDYDSDKTEVLLEKEMSGVRLCSKNSLSVWGELPKELQLLLRTSSSRCRWFNHKELMDATSQFSSENLIAKSRCSSVYKGYLLDGKTVAVKIMKMSKEAWKDYILEVDIISSLQHKHIVPLLGVCMDDNDLILVYDFLSNGSLEENLNDAKQKQRLSWEQRFNVAIEVAEAINYLHKECSRPVIHRDIKSSNILLSNEFEAQISDFGLAIWGSTSSSETHSDVVGTFGYLAPEYFMYGKISDKIDVYSFGVVLLELLSGKKPISTGTLKGQESLVMWAKPILESGDVMSILDPNLPGEINEVQMQRMLLAVNLCITRTARLRPEMNQILKLLRGEKDVDELVDSIVKDQEELNNLDDDEFYPDSSVESHREVALLDVDDETISFSSVDQHSHHTFEDYLKGRCSRSSSFD
ncbi:kinase domain [Thalictrum thalictroides]|uniref:Kinase domain n=1 Tax=Thalictrum thalictroides TaxID=46969 RepID=A0A7J6W5T0_THATH|nr:kinase domain [Thalictrum thalictroides]